ncbi:restriction endonuclease subunit S [Kribbella sp. NPDC058693]|uniref:restriction endonuclease subunit S n=1 Tax=Kribbella sp. NPDC058693 TaxID=3346602 RepID=UPI00365D66BB
MEAGAEVDGWRKVRLGDIGQSLIGLTYEPKSVKRAGTLVLRSSNIQDGQLAFGDNVYVDCSIPERIRIREQDILICVRNGSRRLIGKSIILDARVVGETFGAFMAIYRSNLNGFLQYFFQSDDFKHQIDEHLGATINQITNGSLNSFVVALPGSAEREEIARRLADVDRLIAKLNRIVTKKQEIKQGMMQQLLTGGTRLPGFNEPWTEIRLGEIGQSLIGLTYSPSSVKRSGTLVLRSSNIQDGRIDFNDNVFVDSPIPDKIRIRANDILICVRNGSRRLIGKSVLLDERVTGQTFGAFMAVYRSDANPFLQYFFQSDEFKRQIDEHLGATINQITNGSLNRFVVALPSPAEQKEIASRLNDVDTEIAFLRKRLDKAQVVKQGMMQELLTGRTRLPVTEPAL